MRESRDWIKIGYYLSAIANFNILVFSIGFTNQALIDPYPEVFSRFGLFAILLWGAAYAVVAPRARELRSLAAVFTVEKFAYVGTWAYFWSQATVSLTVLFEQSILAGVFYAIYGLNDLLFGVLFGYVALGKAENVPSGANP